MQKEHNVKLMKMVVTTNPLKELYLGALEEMHKRYKDVSIRLWNTGTSDPNFVLDLEYRGRKAQGEIWGQRDGVGYPAEVFFKVVSLVSNKTVALARMYKDVKGKIRVSHNIDCWE